MNISVIIPTYNRIQTLPRAIGSVLNQTTPVTEIIIINDCSTDQTKSYLESLSDPRITVIHFDQNKGGCTARNEGVAASHGDILAFIDDDDVWQPDKINKQLGLLAQQNADVCYTAKEVIDSKGKRSYSYGKPSSQNIRRAIMKDNFIGSTSSVLIRRKKFNKAGGFDPKLPGLQDYDLYIRLINHGATIVGIDEPLTIYHIVNPHRSITCGFNEFRIAAHYLTNKYTQHQYIADLKFGLFSIGLRRFFKTRRFFKEAIEYTFKKKHTKHKKNH